MVEDHFIVDDKFATVGIIGEFGFTEAYICVLEVSGVIRLYKCERLLF